MSQRRFRSGFTLVELLIVVAIIALLVTIVLPVLVKAKESATNLKCVTNERGLGVCHMFNAQDFNSGITTIIRNSDNPAWGDTQWYTLLNKYGKRVFERQSAKDPWVSCPKNKTSYDSYGQNEGVGFVYWPGHNSIGLASFPVRFDQIKCTSATEIMAESPTLNHGDNVISVLGKEVYTNPSQGWMNVPTPHFGRYGVSQSWVEGAGNFLWTDGHVTTIYYNRNWLTMANLHPPKPK